MKGQPLTVLTVGTMNVPNLSGRVTAVGQLAAAAKARALALHETRITREGFKRKATSNALAALGWQLHLGPQGQDARGLPRGSAAFITDWPAEVVTLPKHLQFEYRAMAIKVARATIRPLLRLNADTRPPMTSLMERTSFTKFYSGQWPAARTSHF